MGTAFGVDFSSGGAKAPFGSQKLFLLLLKINIFLCFELFNILILKIIFKK